MPPSASTVKVPASSGLGRSPRQLRGTAMTSSPRVASSSRSAMNPGRRERRRAARRGRARSTSPTRVSEVGRVGLGGLGLRVVGHEAEVCHSWGSARRTRRRPTIQQCRRSAAAHPFGHRITRMYFYFTPQMCVSVYTRPIDTPQPHRSRAARSPPILPTPPPRQSSRRARARAPGLPGKDSTMPFAAVAALVTPPHAVARRADGVDHGRRAIRRHPVGSPYATARRSPPSSRRTAWPARAPSCTSVEAASPFRAR